MRILVSLDSLKDCSYDLRYYHNLQGFLYSLIKDTPYSSLHDRDSCKFFSFSSIFPHEDLKTGDSRKLMVSSPDLNLMNLFLEKLNSLKERKYPINIGEMLFSVSNVQPLRPKIGHSCSLITGTPIVLRIPKENYSKYGINPQKDYPYLYWRKDFSFEAFLRQLEDNLAKKYNEFYKTSLNPEQIFSQFVFKKQVCNHAIINGKELQLIGSVWEFPLPALTEDQRALLQFGLDAGFGELNSLGFGFMNIAEH